jgi:hypothetical protein
VTTAAVLAAASARRLRGVRLLRPALVRLRLPLLLCGVLRLRSPLLLLGARLPGVTLARLGLRLLLLGRLPGVALPGRALGLLFAGTCRRLGVLAALGRLA